MSDTTHSIFRSAKHFLTGTMFSRVTGFMRDIAMAFAFGTHSSIAAFLVAFRLSHLLRRLFGEGALQTAFIPQFEKLKTEDPQRACQFFRDLTLMLSVFLLGIIVIAMGVLGYLNFSSYFSEDNREIITLTLIMMPGLLFICLFGLNASLLQCEKSYFIPGIAPVAFNAIWIVGIACLWKMPHDQAVMYLGGFLNLACFAQWLVTLPKTIKILKKYHFTHLWTHLTLFSKDLKLLMKPLALAMVGVGATQINSALDALFARYASSEGPAYLWYALRIQQLPLALIGIAISGALLPPLSRAIKGNDLLQCHHFLNFSLKKCMAFMLPMSIGIFALGEGCVAVLYGRGGFTEASVLSTTQCLWGYGFGLVPMTLVLILAPAFYAQNSYRLPMQASIFSMILNVILNFIVIILFENSTAGIAWTTSISAWFNFFVLALFLKQSLGKFVQGLWWPCSGKILISSMIGWGTVLFLEQKWEFWNLLTQFCITSILFCLVTWVTAKLIRSSELSRLLTESI